MARLLPITLSLVIVFVAVLVAACADSPTITPSQDATFTLVPPTATPIPMPLTPTPSPDLELVDPSSFLTRTPNVDSFLPSGASQSVQAAVEDLRTTRGVEPIRLLSLKSVEWENRSLGCGDREISFVPLTSRGRIPGYRIVLGNDEAAYVYHTDDAGAIILCPEAPLFTTEGTPLFFDPISESLSISAREDLADTQELDLDTIEVVDITTITWTDTSLGCPFPDVDYRTNEVTGYRLLLKSGDELYSYHSDGLEIQYCPDERESLPPPFSSVNVVQVTPTPAPSITP